MMMTKKDLLVSYSTSSQKTLCTLSSTIKSSPPHRIASTFLPRGHRFNGTYSTSKTVMMKKYSVWFFFLLQVVFLSCGTSSFWWRFFPTCCGALVLDEEQQQPKREQHQQQPQQPRRRQRQQQQQDDGGARRADAPDEVEQFYNYYPDYCSTQDQIAATRNIPPLSAAANNVGETRLIHVAAITRHGARTPLLEDTDDTAADGSYCWKGYMDKESDTSVWDCTLTTWMGTPPVSAIPAQAAQIPLDNDYSFMWIDKRYDAFSTSYSSSLTYKNDNNNKNLHDYLSNRWNGTCQMGQLLTHGYHQLHDIGRILRRAYLYPTTSSHNGDVTMSTQHDERMRLTSDTLQKNSNQLDFRVDDLPRTILSGQALFHGLFGHEPLSWQPLNGNHDFLKDSVIIPMTMIDYSRDVFGIHQESCPRLQELHDQAWASAEFLQLQQSPESRLWLKFLKTNFGRVPRNTIDCLMTTICNDKTLPAAINDFVGGGGSRSRRRRRQRRMENISSSSRSCCSRRRMTEKNATTPALVPTSSSSTAAATQTTSPIISSSSSSWSSEWDEEYGRDRFRRLVDFSTKNASFPFTYQNAVISKLAMTPLWMHLLKNIKAATKATSVDDASYPKLALVSSHDSTIWALLASLGMNSLLDHVPPYASVLLLEIHEFIGGSRNTSTFASNFALRMVYNGQVVTSLLPGCSSSAASDLCDLQVLIKRHVETFASTSTRQRNCSVTTAAATKIMAGSDDGSSSSPSNGSNTTNNNGVAGAPSPALDTLVAGLSSQDIQETRDAFRSPVGISGLTLLAIVGFGVGSLITVCILSKQHRYDTF